MPAWMDGCFDGWKDGCVSRHVCVCVYVCIYIHIYICTTVLLIKWMLLSNTTCMRLCLFCFASGADASTPERDQERRSEAKGGHILRGHSRTDLRPQRLPV